MQIINFVFDTFQWWSPWWWWWSVECCFIFFSIVVGLPRKKIDALTTTRKKNNWTIQNNFICQHPEYFKLKIHVDKFGWKLKKKIYLSVVVAVVVFLRKKKEVNGKIIIIVDIAIAIKQQIWKCFFPHYNIRSKFFTLMRFFCRCFSFCFVWQQKIEIIFKDKIWSKVVCDKTINEMMMIRKKEEEDKCITLQFW